MPNKSWRLTRYLFKEQLQYLGWTYLIVILAETLLPFFLSLINGTISGFSWPSHLSGLGIGAIFGFFIFLVYLQTYDNFKLFIQNGISRQTYWLARCYNLLIMSGVGVILAILNDFAIAAPLLRVDVFGLLARGPYQMYAKFFGDNAAVTVLVYMLFLWIVFLTCGLFGMAISSILDLLSKTIRRIVYIVVPILGLFLLVTLSMTAGKAQASATMIAITNFLKFLLGYHQTLGLFNPVMPLLTMLVISLLLAGIAYYFNRKLIVKN